MDEVQEVKTTPSLFLLTAKSQSSATGVLSICSEPLVAHGGDQMLGPLGAGVSFEEELGFPRQ